MACNLRNPMGPGPLLILLLTSGPDTPPPPDPQQLVPVAAPATTTTNDSIDQPITGTGRLDWAVHATIGPASLWTGVLTSTWGTVFNRPHEYGESFDGFAKRYGLRLTGVATSNVMEATVGSFWGEDPRYHMSTEERFGGRFKHALKMTVMAQRNDGSVAPAYARFIAIAGGNALSNTWRPDSEHTAGDTLTRIGEGFGGRLLSNIWDEFWPSVKNHMFWNKH